MERQTGSQTINNDFYDELAEKWYTASNHPIALLRAENAVRIPWILQEIGLSQTVLDIGCGAGLLTNALSLAGHFVTGVDISVSSLQIAEQYDSTQKVCYRVANAYCLPFADQSFDVVCAMDVLEHVEEPSLLIAEASRVLKPSGCFFFHTFNRNLLSYFLVIKGVDWFVPNAPKNMHVYPLFIKPKELERLFLERDLEMETIRGFRPQVFTKEFFQMVLTRQIPETIRFCFSKNLATGYCGFARKKREKPWSRSP